MQDTMSVENTITKREKRTFSLLDPEDHSTVIGKFTSHGYREAALKAASRGHKNIVLRAADVQDKIRTFSGEIVTLTDPKVVQKANRTITFNKRPSVKYLQTIKLGGDKPRRKYKKAPVVEAPIEAPVEAPVEAAVEATVEAPVASA